MPTHRATTRPRHISRETRTTEHSRKPPFSRLPFANTDVSRRRFLGYVVAAPTLVVAAELGRQAIFDSTPNASAAAVPSARRPPRSTTCRMRCAMRHARPRT